jgi:hypothetical protein
VLVVLLAGQLGDMALFHLVLAEMPHDLAESLRPQMARMLGSFAAGFLWLLYWFNSRRVANSRAVSGAGRGRLSSGHGAARTRTPGSLAAAFSKLANSSTPPRR